MPDRMDGLLIHTEARRLLVAAGLDRTAELGPSVITRSQVRRISDASGMKKASFNSVEEAEAWLDAKGG